MAKTPRPTKTPTKDKTKQLEAENAKLRKQLESAKQSESKRKHRILQKIGIVFFTALAAATLVCGNIIFWAGRTVVDTNRYTSITSQVIQEPAVQQAIATDITNKIFENVDVQQILSENLPPRAAFLAQPLASQAQNYTEKTIQTILANEKFQSVWNDAQKEIHSRVITTIRNYEGNGVIDLNDIYQKVVGNLSDTKLSFLSNTKLPASVGSITVVDASWLPVAHNIVVNLSLYRLLTICAFLVASALAILLARNRRKQVIVLALIFAFSMLATLIALRITQNELVASSASQNQAAVKAIGEIVFASLILQIRLMLASSLIIAILAWISGPYRSATVVRERINQLLSGKIHQSIFGKHENGLTRFVGRHQAKLFWTYTSVVALSIAVMSITTARLISFVVSVAVVAIVLEILAEPQKK